MGTRHCTARDHPQTQLLISVVCLMMNKDYKIILGHHREAAQGATRVTEPLHHTDQSESHTLSALPPLRKKHRWLSGIGVSLLVLLLLASIGGTFYFYESAKKLVADLQQTPEQKAAAELADVVQKVSVHMVLPRDETPTLASVIDPNALKNQPFFVHALKGDKLLLFPNSHKAILYRPSTDQIIDVGPLRTENADIPLQP